MHIKNAFFFFFLFFVFSFFPLKSHAAVADNFIYPLSFWDGMGTQHGEQMSNGLYHMGVDDGFILGDGAAVYATANGVVKEAQERSQFGLVVLIEHTLTNGSRIVSLYGHLRPSDRRVLPGQQVKAGDIVGVLGDESENGGWTPHLHFGIHKQPYTGAWVYYGHVSDSSLTDDWYEPVSYIKEHLTADAWTPNARLDGLKDGQLVSSFVPFNVSVTDIGSGVHSLEVKISNDGKKTWQLIGESTADGSYPYQFMTSLADYPDGKIYIRVIALDVFGNKIRKTIWVRKKPDAFVTTHVAAIKGAPSSGIVTTYYQSGIQQQQFRAYKKSWHGGGDIATGDVIGDGTTQIVTVNGAGHKTLVRVFNEQGKRLYSFPAFPSNRKNGAQIAVGDINGDMIDEIIVGSGPGKRSQVKVFTKNGTMLSTLYPFNKKFTFGVDVVVCDVNGDAQNELIVGTLAGKRSSIAIFDAITQKRIQYFHPFEKKYTGGIRIATGDVDGDHVPEIIVGTGGERSGEIRVFEIDGTQKEFTMQPFGAAFTGSIDVSTTDWENDGTAEIMASQADNGEAWVKTYKYNKKHPTLFYQRVFTEGFLGGTHITAW
ncbi:MAG TPA: peptidoglycan DD-metalloendopeptidase family protein [Patescibacteria group bacterium]|nr:peptidoglycan DD-metalloendopeptidase family protein [Patescibacteria group bacterium]